MGTAFRSSTGRTNRPTQVPAVGAGGLGRGVPRVKCVHDLAAAAAALVRQRFQLKPPPVLLPRSSAPHSVLLHLGQATKLRGSEPLRQLAAQTHSPIAAVLRTLLWKPCAVTAVSQYGFAKRLAQETPEDFPCCGWMMALLTPVVLTQKAFWKAGKEQHPLDLVGASQPLHCSSWLGAYPYPFPPSHLSIGAGDQTLAVDEGGEGARGLLDDAAQVRQGHGNRLLLGYQCLGLCQPVWWPRVLDPDRQASARPQLHTNQLLNHLINWTSSASVVAWVLDP